MMVKELYLAIRDATCIDKPFAKTCVVDRLLEATLFKDFGRPFGITREVQLLFYRCAPNMRITYICPFSDKNIDISRATEHILN